MEKLHIVTIALLVSGIVLISVSLGTGVASIKGEYWIDYAYNTTTSTTASGFPALVVAVATANIGLYTTCHSIATTTTLITGIGNVITTIYTTDCVDLATTGYIDAGLFLFLFFGVFCFLFCFISLLSSIAPVVRSTGLSRIYIYLHIFSFKYLMQHFYRIAYHFSHLVILIYT